MQTLYRIPVHAWRWLWWLLLSQLAVAALWWQLGWVAGLSALFLSHAVFVLPVFLPNSGFYAPVLSRLPSPGRQVWLTIDDGPSDDTLAILDLLDRHDAQATFFLVGERAIAHPALVQAIRARGHGIGNHSHSHPQARFWALGPAQLAREIGDCQRALVQLGGTTPRWYRSVVGMTNPFVAAALKRHRLTRVGWSARGFDGVDCQPQQVIGRISPQLKPGAIVLLHEGAAHGHARVIIEAILEELQARGLQARIPVEPVASAEQSQQHTA